MGYRDYTDADRRNLSVFTFIGAFILPLMSTMMNLAMVYIGDDFGVGSHDLGYINTMFLLGSVITMVPAARLASIHGMRKVFLLGLAIIVTTASLAALSPGFWFLIAMRFAIGAGASMMTVTSVAMLTYVYPPDRRGFAIGVNSTGVYIGLSLGPTCGGLISGSVGWRWAFVLVVFLSLVALFFALRFRREVVPSPGEGMDWSGAALWGVSLFVLMFGLMNVTDGYGKVMIAVGIVMLALTVLHLSRASSPVLNLRLFRSPRFSASCVAAFANYGASYSVSFFLSLYLQSIGALTAAEAGLLMLIQPLGQVLLTAKMGALQDRMRDKRILPFAGMLITLAGVSMFLFIGTDYSLPYVVLLMALVGVGLGVFASPNTTNIMSFAPPKLRGEASGVVAVVRQTGMILSMSIAMASIAVVMGSADNLGPDTYGEFVDVLKLAFGICAAMCAVGAACSLAGKRKEKD